MQKQRVISVALLFFAFMSIAAASTRVTNEYINTTGTMNATEFYEGGQTLGAKYVEWNDALPWANLTGIPQLGNTTKQIWTVADNGTFVRYYDNFYNTTKQVWTVCDNGTFQTGAERDTDTNVTSICSGAQLLLANGSCVSDTNYLDDTDTDTHRGNTTSEIWAVVDNLTFVKFSDYLYNTSVEVWAVIQNGTFQYDIGSDCSANNYVYGVSDDGTLLCRADVSGGGGGAGVWMVTGEVMTANGTVGGKQNINGTGFVNYSYFNSSADQWCNQTACYTIANFLTDTDTDTYNSTKDIWTVVDNITFIKWTDSLPWVNLTGVPALGNSTKQIWAVVDNSTFVRYTDHVYNTTKDIWTVADNSTFVKYTDHQYNTSAEMSTAINASGVPYASITGHPADDDQPDDDSEVPDNITVANYNIIINTTGIYLNGGCMRIYHNSTDLIMRNDCP